MHYLNAENEEALNMSVNIYDEVLIPMDFSKVEIANRVISTVLEFSNFPFEAEVNITLVDLDTIREINKEQRHIDNATDVLSFPMLTYQTAGDFSTVEEQQCVNPETGEVVLGDIVLCMDRVISQALEFKHSILREYAFLIAHSMFHLLGYDHMIKEEEIVMFDKQEKIMNLLNIRRNSNNE